jgi:ABC-type amino acid transport system permease subunit
MNPAFIAKAGPVFLKAVGLTSVLALAGILISLLAGFLAAMLDYHKVPILKSLSRAYIGWPATPPS